MAWLPKRFKLGRHCAVSLADTLEICFLHSFTFKGMLETIIHEVNEIISANLIFKELGTFEKGIHFKKNGYNRHYFVSHLISPYGVNTLIYTDNTPCRG